MDHASAKNAEPTPKVEKVAHQEPAAEENFCGVMNGHSDEVNSVQFSPDGQKIVSASADKTVRVWCAVTGDLEQTLKGHSFVVNLAQFSPDGQKIVSASRDKTVRVWCAVTGDLEQMLEGHSSVVYSAQFSLDGQKIVSASNDKRWVLPVIVFFLLFTNISAKRTQSYIILSIKELHVYLVVNLLLPCDLELVINPISFKFLNYR